MKTGDRVRHYKGGTYVILSPVALMEAGKKNNETVRYVVYKSEMYGHTWIREKEEFHGFATLDGKAVKRFQIIEKSEDAKHTERFHDAIDTMPHVQWSDIHKPSNEK